MCRKIRFNMIITYSHFIEKDKNTEKKNPNRIGETMIFIQFDVDFITTSILLAFYSLQWKKKEEKKMRNTRANKHKTTM